MCDYIGFGISQDRCTEYTAVDFNNKYIHPDDLFVLNFNIRSFNCNYDEFSVFVHDLNLQPDIIILTETWFTVSNQSCIEGYVGHHCVRENRSGGGVSVFVKGSSKGKIFARSTVSLPEIELVHLNIVFDELYSIDVVAIYRPPDATMLEFFFSKFEEILDSIPVSKKLILAGDLNICGLSQNLNSTKLLDIAHSFSLTPHIIIPTRPNPSGNHTQIDHIWSNFGNDFNAGIFDTGITDHFVNFVIFPKKIKRKKLKITFRDHSETCIKK